MGAAQQMLVAQAAAGGGGGLPLDAYTANLFAAGGLKQLLTSYVGSAIRVRRSSDDTEQDVPFAAGVLDTTSMLAFTGAANAYASYANVAMYIPITGATGSTAFRCVKGHTCTAVGDAQVDTTLGFPAAKFDGSGDRIDVTIGRSIQLGNGDFRIRLKLNAISIKTEIIMEIYNGSPSTSQFYMQINNALGQLECGLYSGGGTAGVCTSANGTILVATTYDIEYGRSGTSFQLSVNGASVATATSSATANVGIPRLEIGGDMVDGAIYTFNGYIWGISIEPGVAGHLGSFTPDALYGTEGDGFVSKVYDQSGGGFDFAQATLPSQPRIVSNAAALTDVTFDGADDFLATASNSGTPTAVTDFYQGNYRLSTLAGDSWISLQLPQTFASGHGCYLAVGHTNALGWGVSDGAGNSLLAQGASNSNFSTLGVVAGLFDKSQTGNAKRRAFYNGGEITASSTATNGTVGTGAFDAALWYAGGLLGDTSASGPLNLRQLAIYQAAQSDANVAAISTALS